MKGLDSKEKRLQSKRKEDLTKERKETKDEERGMLSHSLYFRSRAIG
jgi:hypothetical protein